MTLPRVVKNIEHYRTTTDLPPPSLQHQAAEAPGSPRSAAPGEEGVQLLLYRILQRSETEMRH